MFIDKAKILIKAGDGGNGAVSFHREKYVAAGGPDGGDGGKGGDVIFVVDDNCSTLADFRYKRKFTAQDGKPGSSGRSYGKSGQNLIVRVPRGTIVTDSETGRLIADMSDSEPAVIAKGGRGGWGNRHFATPTRQCPRFAKSGMPGEKIEAVLELKLLADVGLIGFPNVGKSSLLSVVSNAKPNVANYHFTTLNPILGVVEKGENSFVMADIPGLIEGASEGVGLGHEFLRHVERCRLLVHVVDVSGSEGRDPKEDFVKINSELESFNSELAERPQIVAGNKCDLTDDETLDDFRKFVEDLGYEFYPIIAPIQEGTDELIDAIREKLSKLPPIITYEAQPPVLDEIDRGDRHGFTVKVEDGVYIVEAEWLARILNMVDMDDYESLQYFQRVLHSSGIIDRLIELGIQPDDTVSIYDFEFDYVP